MSLSKSMLRLALALKIKHLRNKEGISLTSLAELAGVSKSYLNEIENAKKYPQADKLMAISNGLGVSYDDLVSLRFPGELAFLDEYFGAAKLNEIPLEALGLTEEVFTDLMVRNTESGMRFIHTIHNLKNHHSMGGFGFIQAALAARKELVFGYYKDLEVLAVAFSDHIKLDAGLSVEEIILRFKAHLGLNVLFWDNEERMLFDKDTAVYLKSKNTLFLNPDSETEMQRLLLFKAAFFVYSKKVVPTKFKWNPLRYNSFQEGVEHENSAYFALALAMPFFELKKFMQKSLKVNSLNLRDFELATKHFGLQKDFFLERLASGINEVFDFERFMLFEVQPSPSKSFHIVKMDLRLLDFKQQESFDFVENYCKRSVFTRINKKEHSGSFDVQRVNFHVNHLTLDLLLIAVRQSYEPDGVKGLVVLVTDEVIAKWKFVKNLPIEDVGLGCQSCLIEDCDLRGCEPYIIQRSLRNLELQKAMEKVIRERT